MPTKYRWLKQPVDDVEGMRTLQSELNDLPEALARALVLRGIDSFDAARRYFRPERDVLHDPFLMQDMQPASERLAEAINAGEDVLVYGDYDVDGTTSAALMTDFLRQNGLMASFFIPHREKHGYGLSKSGIDEAAKRDVSLIVALDCGITAHEEAEYARSKGIDLIICDHHTAGSSIPDATAVLDPKRPDCNYPFDELSGCGVGFKLVQATLTQLDRSPEEAFQFSDLLAISIASDIVPVGGENRVFLREGLKKLGSNPRLGLQVMADMAGLDLESMTVGNIVFTIGPRINAAGRIESARPAVELMLAKDEATAIQHAETLERLNKQRKGIDQETTNQAIRRAKNQMAARHRHALVLHQNDWHQGVIGIVASRVVEEFYRPTVMLTSAGDVLKGSARSISGVNIYDALSNCDDLLEQFGGHDYAAGLTLKPSNLDAFRERLNSTIEEVTTPDMLLPAIKVDAEVDLADVGTVNDRFWAVLKQFGPFGPGNSRPIFRSTNLALAGSPRTVGQDGSHLKFAVRPVDDAAGSAAKDVIGFGMGDHLSTLKRSQKQGMPVELLFSIEENTWRGNTSLQLKARDLRLAEQETEKPVEVTG